MLRGRAQALTISRRASESETRLAEVPVQGQGLPLQGLDLCRAHIGIDLAQGLEALDLAGIELHHGGQGGLLQARAAGLRMRSGVGQHLAQLGLALADSLAGQAALHRLGPGLDAFETETFPQFPALLVHQHPHQGRR